MSSSEEEEKSFNLNSKRKKPKLNKSNESNLNYTTSKINEKSPNPLTYNELYSEHGK